MDVTEAPAFDTSEADRVADYLEATQPDIWSKVALFPIYPFTPDGRCTCSRPSCSAVGKHPCIEGWTSLAPGTKMLKREDGVGLGVSLVTGSAYGGIVVLDLDIRPGDIDGAAALRELETVLGELPPTLVIGSPTGGEHHYYLSPAKLKTVGGDTAAREIAEGVDLRGEGGQVLFPGSPHKRGGTYRVKHLRPIAHLPAAWIEFLPKAGPTRTARPPSERLEIDVSTLRQRIADWARGKHGPGPAVWRRALKGDPLFRIEGGRPYPEHPDLPIVHGVDVHMSQTVLWGLACDESWDWYMVPGPDIAAVLQVSLSHLDHDAGGTKWTTSHVADVWERTVAKVAPLRERAKEIVAALTRGVEREAAGLPLAIQFGKKFRILDDREDPPRYLSLLVEREQVVGLARQIWTGKGRELDLPTKGGTRSMTWTEFAEAYARHGVEIAYDYAATRPRLEDVRLVLPPALDHARPAPREDPDVWGWIAALDPAGDLERWIAWACPERCGVAIPALALIGESTVGKTVLVMALARAAGLAGPVTLASAFGRFRAPLLDNPIVFADEGMPRGRRGEPLTQEFRQFTTALTHHVELKGVSSHVTLRGSPRVVLAANSLDRLFHGASLNTHDLTALLRRLVVINLEGPRMEEARRLVTGLGVHPSDPARIERIAGHIRYLQAGPPPALPEPVAGDVGRALRRGTDATAQALEVLEDAAGTVDWIAVDRAGGSVWVRNDAWIMRLTGSDVRNAQSLRRAAIHYVVGDLRCRTHPVTGVSLSTRARWIRLDLARLEADGFSLDVQDPPR